MTLGILKEIKEGENRVICTPREVQILAKKCHVIYVEQGAGKNAGFSDEEYVKSGAKILGSAKEIYETCEFVSKVKEIEPSEYDLLKENQIIFTCIHPAAHKEEVDALINKKVTAFTAEDTHRHDSPNCEAAGKVGAFMGLYGLMNCNNGCGKFASGLGGAPNIRAIVLGCGSVGKAAISVLYSMGSHISVGATNVQHLRDISDFYNGKISTFVSDRHTLAKMLPNTDLVVNCVRWPKDNKEFLITRKMVASMPKGAVISDISCDYGVIETYKPTTHTNPYYVEEGVVHYCVSNIPSLIANSASISYAASILPLFLNIMENGVKKACETDPYLRRSLTTFGGYLTHEETSKIQNRPWVKPEVILGLGTKNLEFAPKLTKSVSTNFYPEYKKECEKI